MNLPVSLAMAEGEGTKRAPADALRADIIGLNGRLGAHSAPMGTVGPDIWASGFRLIPARRRLERDGASIAIGAKAFDLLAILVSRAGEVVEKAELLERIWHGRAAEESSLRFHIKALRSALGDRELIVNVAGQGYCFVGTVSKGPPASLAEPGSARTLALPHRPQLVGREGVLDGLEAQIFDRRFITIVGPGGVGKTSVAVELGHRLAAAFDGDVCFLDVSGYIEPRLFVDGLALALGIPVQATAAPPSIATFLSNRRLLLILDGCEPAIETAAALAEEVFHEGPEVHLLVTSREALRAEGEYVCRLSPLPYPMENETVSASRALEFPAVQLFLRRAEANLQGFAVTDENAAMVGAVCRKLDGLALAIEVAAARVEAHGVGEIDRQLDNHFALRWPGRRTAVARHQTLTAALDWSHAFLTEAERIGLRRISLFPGSFTLEMAVAIAHGWERVSEGDPTDVLGGLVAKSLVQRDQTGQRACYRLLDTTRDYARQKLQDAGELALINKRHAALVLALVERHSAGPDPDLGGLDLADLLANVRAVLKVALDVDGDREVAAALVAAAAPIWLKNRLPAECRLWTTRAVETIEPTALGLHRQERHYHGSQASGCGSHGRRKL